MLLWLALVVGLLWAGSVLLLNSLQALGLWGLPRLVHVWEALLGGMLLSSSVALHVFSSERRLRMRAVIVFGFVWLIQVHFAIQRMYFKYGISVIPDSWRSLLEQVSIYGIAPVVVFLSLGLALQTPPPSMKE